MADTPPTTATTPSNEPVSFTLPQLSVSYLDELLNTTQWPASLFQIGHGAAAIEALPDLAAKPADVAALPKDEKDPAVIQTWVDAMNAHAAASAEWAAVPVAFTLSAKQVKATKACLTFWLDTKPDAAQGKPNKPALPFNPYSVKLVTAFDLTIPDDDVA